MDAGGARARRRDRPDECFTEGKGHARVLLARLRREHCATKLIWTCVQMGVIRSLQRTTLAELVEFAHPTTAFADLGRPWLTSRSATCTSAPGTSPSSTGWTCASARGDPRPDGPQRLRQVDPGQRDHGPPQPRHHRGPSRLDGKDITEADRQARRRRPVHGLPVPRRHPRRDDHEVPAWSSTPPRRARRAADPAEGVPPDGRGRDGAHERPKDSRAATSTTASPAARRSAWRSRWRCRSPSSPYSTRPTPGSTSTRSTPSRASTRSPRARHGRLIITHYQRILHMVIPQFVHIMFDGRIVKEGGPELVEQLEKRGYARSATRSPRRHDLSPLASEFPVFDARGSPTSTRPRRPDAARRDRGDGPLLPRGAGDRAPFDLRARRRGDGDVRGRAHALAAFTGSTPARRLHPQHDRGDQPRRVVLGPRQHGRGRRDRRHRRWSTTPTSCRGRCSPRTAARRSLRRDRRRRLLDLDWLTRCSPAGRSWSRSRTSRTCYRRSTPSRRSPAARTPPAR